MILTWLRTQRDEVEQAYIRAVARRDLHNMTLLSHKLCNLVDEIARLEEIQANSGISYS